MPADRSTSAAADRNLLFGILALQMNFISRDALISAMSAWVVDKSKSLGQILGDQRALQKEDRDLLDVLIKRHLQKHGDNVQRSLASLSSVGSLHNDLKEVADPDLNASLAYVPGPDDPTDDAGVTGMWSTGQRSVAGLRFRVLHEHARGGVGAVFVAEDEELHRRVALKEIQEKYAHNVENQLRFLLEAEVTGGLEHPGIVPVYGLGRYPDGRPFYAMRFIRGDSLHEAIRRFYAADEKKRDHGERSLAFRELLGQFVAACNALAYAHARGVLHRDVKPHNIMVGKYGETLVVDWGLAKVMGVSDGQSKSEEGTLHPSTGGDSTPTQAGHVMGTPAYMSPEQAEGRQAVLSPAADIYSLGATLYALLTGQPPIQGRSVGEMLDLVRLGDWLPPRKVRKDVPLALDAICRKAMALRPEARYATALALAGDVEHWLADEPVSAYREPWMGKLRRWVRRHRGLAAGVAGLLITTVTALAIVLAVVKRAKDRTEQALAAEARAKQRTREAYDAMSGQVIDDWLSQQKGTLEPAQKRFLEKALESYRGFAEESGDSPEVQRGVAQAHVRVGDILKKLGQYEAAELEYRRASALSKKLADDFPTMPQYRQDLAENHNNLAILLKDTGRLKEAEEEYRKSLTLLKELVAQFPSERRYLEKLAGSNNNLGHFLEINGQLDKAEGAYREAGDVYKQLSKTFREVLYYHGLASSRCNLGGLLRARERFPEAEQPLRAARETCQLLLAEYPDMPEFRQDLAQSHSELGLLLNDTRQLKEAEEEYRKALDLRQRLAADYPAVPDYRRDLARSYINLGALQAVMGRSQEAETAYRNALGLTKRLVEGFPNVPDYQSDLAKTMVNLAELCRDRGDFQQARTLLQEAHPYHEAALKAYPLDPTYRQSFRDERVVLASALAGLGDHDGARQTAEQLATLNWDPARDAYAAARALAHCIPEPEKNAKPTESKQQELVKAYTERALMMLRQAIRKGYPKKAAYLKKDKDLDRLHAHPEFQKLLEKLDAQVAEK